MKLTLVLLVSCASLHFTTPDAGSWWLMSTSDRLSWRVEASGYSPVACHVSVHVARDEAVRIFSVRFDSE